MAMRWIGEAARELGIEVWDAVALLVHEDEYPMNGLLDEERFQILKRAAKKGTEASASAAVASPPLFREEPTTEVTTPVPLDRSEAKTVIYPKG